MRNWRSSPPEPLSTEIHVELRHDTPGALVHPLSRSPLQKRAQYAGQHVASEEGECDSAGELGIIDPFEARLRHDRVAGIQVLRDRHRRNCDQTERNGEATCGSPPAAG